MGGFLMTCVRISALPFICRKEGSIVNGRIPCDLRAHQRTTYYTLYLCSFLSFFTEKESEKRLPLPVGSRSLPKSSFIILS